MMSAALCYNYLRRVLFRQIRVQNLSAFSFSSTQEERSETTVDAGKILSADGPETLFELINKKSVTVQQASNALIVLSKWKTSNILTSEQILKNDKFLYLCKVLEDHFHQVNAGTLLFALRNLLVIGVPPDDHVVMSLENQVLWLMGKMTFRNLVNLLSFHVDFQANDLQKKVVSEAIKRIQHRWYEADQARDIIQLARNLSLFPEEFISKLEDRALECAEKMSAEEASKLVCVMAEKRRRPTPLLRALSFYMSKHQQNLTIKQIVNLLHAIAALSFPDELLLERLSTDLLPEMPNVKSPANLSVILTAFGQLRWRHIDLLEAAAEWLQKNHDRCRLQEIVALVLAMAKLNFQPSNAESVFLQLIPRLSRETVAADATWLDVVWSLVVLRRATEQHVSSVLNPEFYKKLIGQATYGHRLKLLNINAYAQYELRGYAGPRLQHELLSKDVTISRSSDEQVLSASVISTLGNFIPLGTFLQPSGVTPVGVYIDAEFQIGKDGKPLLPTGKGSGETSKRVALIVTRYKDFCLCSSEISGIALLSVRLLEAAGYAVLRVPHTEYEVHATTLKRVQYLQNLISGIAGK